MDLETDQLITEGAHFLSVTKKDLVADAVRMYIEHRREEIRRGMAESMRVLDGATPESRLPDHACSPRNGHGRT